MKKDIILDKGIEITREDKRITISQEGVMIRHEGRPVSREMVGNVPGLDYSLILNEWEKYFYKIHQLKVDFAGVQIPEADDNAFSWFVCIPENFSTERAYDGGKELYAKLRGTDKSLDDILDLSFGRDSWTNPYIVRFRPNWRADVALTNPPTEAIVENLIDVENLIEKIVKKQINTSTLKERLLLEDFLYWKHKRHLDVEELTLCPGSRCSDGSVLVVEWWAYYDALTVGFLSPDSFCYHLRAREVVS